MPANSIPLLPSLKTIPVVNTQGQEDSIGRAYAQVNMVTNLGTITGFDALGRILLGTDTIHAYYGEQLEVTKANAQTAGWPNNSGDIVFPTHKQSDSVYTGS